MFCKAFFHSSVVILTTFCLVLLLSRPRSTKAFQPPTLGLGAVLFPVRGRVIERVTAAETPADKRQALDDASVFFVEAFWTGKVGGGSRTLTQKQRRSLLQSQQAEFNRRYGGSARGRQSELVLCRNGSGDIVGCAGVEVDAIPDGSINGPVVKRAPLMSNLAISRKYRRRGLAEELVEAVEDRCRDWGYDECYLYVEKCNPAAIGLYRKLGYRRLWQDGNARTLVPSTSGDIRNQGTVIVCMMKRLRNSNNFLKSLFR